VTKLTVVYHSVYQNNAALQQPRDNSIILRGFLNLACKLWSCSEDLF